MDWPSAGLVGGCALLVLLVRELWLALTLVQRARAALDDGQAGEAADLLGQYLALPSLLGQRAAVRLLLAQALFADRRPADALACCERLDGRRLPASLATALARLTADCHERLGHGDDAARLRADAAAEEARRAPHAHLERQARVDQLEAEGRWREALDELDQVTELVARGALTGEATDLERLVALRLRLARAQLRLGHYEAAMATAELVLGRVGVPVPLQHEAHVVAGWCYLALDTFDQAQRDAEQAFRIANRAADPARLMEDCLLLGEIGFHRADFVTAMRQYQRVRECGGTGRVLAAVGEAELLGLWGRTAEALVAAERATDLAGPAGSPGLQLLAALSLARLLRPRQPRLAWAQLEPVLATVPSEPRVAVERAALAACLLADLGEPTARAVAELADAREQFGHDRHLMVTVDRAQAELATAAGDHAEAARLWQAALERPPHPVFAPELALGWSQALAALGDTAGATAALRHAAECPTPLGAVEQARKLLTAASTKG